MDKVSLHELFQNSKSFIDDEQPRRMERRLTKFNYIHWFNGWERIHQVEKGSDLETIRVHFFFRSIRTVGIGQQARYGNDNVVVYTDSEVN